ncbi:MAG: hypothetical protein ACOX27_00935 [Caldicoprobacterales bacterium]|jgi:hypothetical protein|nr:zinc ribbon domain-containing protein [Clostridiales bacterium]
MTTLKCKNCNAELKPQDKFCSDCGAVVAVQTTPQQNTHQAPQVQTYQAAQPVTGEQAAAAVTSAETASKLSDGKKSKDNTHLGVFGYVITMLALMVPILGIILVFVWAFGAKTNLARKNYCRAVLVVSGIFLALSITGFIMNYSALMELFRVLAG